MNAKEQIDAINRAYADTDFVLKKPKYVSGINSALSRWVISLAVSNFILFLVEQIAKYFSLIDLETYYQIFRPLYLIINVMPLFFFFSFLLNKDNTLEENHFLKMFSIVPLLISIYKLIFLIFFYIDLDFLLSMYENIPFDIIISIIGLIMIGSYFKNYRYNLLAMVNVIYIFAYCLVRYINRITEQVLPRLQLAFNIMDSMNIYSTVVIIVFAIAVLFIGKEKYDEWKTL